MNYNKEAFNRTRLLLGNSVMDCLDKVRVIVFGVGGVGSWCVEGLVRSGVKHITIVDCDRVSESNINRQLMATVETVGQVKVEAMKNHLLTISPDADIDAIENIFNEYTADNFHLDEYDYIIDCIDSLKDKALLIELATRTKAKFYSSMGAALKLDPTKIEVAEFWKVKGCPLARALRNKFKKSKIFPAHKFLCVYSEELLENKGKEESSQKKQNENIIGTDINNPKESFYKAQINGSLMHITAMFGLTLSGLVIKDIDSKCSKP